MEEAFLSYFRFYHINILPGLNFIYLIYHGVKIFHKY